MHTRRILLAFSLAASAASVAFADLVELNSDVSTDRIEQLTRTLAQGSYAESNDIDIPAETKMSVKLREKTVELNNESLAKKYGSSTSKSYSNNPYSWLVAHPLPDMKRVSSNYGGRTMGGRAENHSGLDMSAPSGTAIYATGPGVVTKSGWGTGYGQYVEINHGNGYLTRYAHASRLIARVGDQVKAGEHIANVGCTGRCTGPHLHYEVVKDGQRKNPSAYLAMLP
ncbi:M23 family metallopeptidase [Acinetobacter terrestris]|jgi:murein DD-endopeptidase MepM/ murein hydrolase activator NlpD|uniref:M23 family metallopeptidase n=1 Tax=Acinetobacter terrestris TaxID=2529843 RepID=A0ABX1UWX8_9GAMM|nr:M23 family metallopeptidase [Acinetobacter terrestris]NNH27284.1 M23 family metallopeptidase [Acinetobacter terrestris]NNH34414.1 M23 family metallopeptidase [Acinetobacter terrestris]TCB55015.1 M23 family metallopeptidase [Acinetobacter terrestris]